MRGKCFYRFDQFGDLIGALHEQYINIGPGFLDIFPHLDQAIIDRKKSGHQADDPQQDDKTKNNTQEKKPLGEFAVWKCMVVFLSI